MKTLELSLSDELHDRLRRIAKKTSKHTNEIARNALAAGLAIRDRSDRRRAILAYACRVAGSTEELDVDLEVAGQE